MTLKLSQRTRDFYQTEIRAMTLECGKVGGINLAQGICDTGVPLPVSDGAKRAMDDGFNTYTRYDGLPRLREAIARKALAYNGIKANPENEIVVSVGSTGALYSACLALLDPGDEVILFEPYYGYHVNTLASVNAVPRYVTMRPPDWTFSMTDLDRAASSKTKAILICTPANPTGKVWTAAELEQVAAFAVRRDIFVITDEIYEYFVYDGRRHISPASLPALSDRTITISGSSKTFSITGWRIGYCVCRRQWAEIIGCINDLIYICAPAPLQLGVAAGLEYLDDSFYSGLLAEFSRKRDLFCSTLKAINLPPSIPQGAYYVMADVSRLPGAASKDKAMYLLHKTGVASVPGSAFYHDASGENMVRFCYAKTDDDLRRACEQLRRLD
jgi:aminotransferase